ncbi:hypothetical protein ABZX93_20135 [Streptomyces sp. NPDC006632]
MCRAWGAKRQSARKSGDAEEIEAANAAIVSHPHVRSEGDARLQELHEEV